MARKARGRAGAPPAGPRAVPLRGALCGGWPCAPAGVSVALPGPSLSHLEVPPRDTSGGYGAGAHLFPSRTEKLSPAAAMILRETVGK